MTCIVLSFPEPETAHRHHFKEFSSITAKTSVSTERPIKNPRSLIQDLGSIYSLSKGTISTLSKGKDLFSVPH